MIPEGRQLDDIADVKTNAVTQGIFTPDLRCHLRSSLDGTKDCVKADDLKKAAGSADLSALSIPDWALDPIKALGNDHRRIEGLIAPGTWNVDPSASAQDILSTLDRREQSAVRAGGTARRGQGRRTCRRTRS